MKIVTRIVAAEEDELARVGESLTPLNEWSGIEWQGLDTDKVVMLHCLLSGDELGTAYSLYEPVYLADAGAILLRIASTVQEDLAEMEDEKLERLADELTATESFEAEAWDAADVLSQLRDLADLARLAETQGQALFVWMHPLPDQ
jgi:hypothetical protein